MQRRGMQGVRGGVVAAVVAVATALVAATGPAAAADPLPAPVGEVVLTMTGDLGRTNAPGQAQFDLAMLQALPVTRFSTTTVWTEGPQAFAGVALTDLLAAVQAEGRRIEATALNDYTIQIPADDLVPGGPILAWEQNGAALSVREFGPLWVVYPYDAKPDYQSETIYARSIWQLNRMQILP